MAIGAAIYTGSRGISKCPTRTTRNALTRHGVQKPILTSQTEHIRGASTTGVFAVRTGLPQKVCPVRARAQTTPLIVDVAERTFETYRRIAYTGEALWTADCAVACCYASEIASRTADDTAVIVEHVTRKTTHTLRLGYAGTAWGLTFGTDS